MYGLIISILYNHIPQENYLCFEYLLTKTNMVVTITIHGMLPESTYYKIFVVYSRISWLLWYKSLNISEIITISRTWKWIIPDCSGEVRVLHLGWVWSLNPQWGTQDVWTLLDSIPLSHCQLLRWTASLPDDCHWRHLIANFPHPLMRLSLCGMMISIEYLPSTKINT